MVLTAIGYDDDSDADKSYNLTVSFDPTPTGSVDLTFGIIEHDGETDQEYTYWNSGDVANFINRESRALIRGALLGAIRHILNAYKFDMVFMCTMEIGAPDKANEKFIRIAHLFEECGYVIRHPDPYYGQEIWWMERGASSAD